LTNNATHHTNAPQPPSNSRDFCTDLGNARRLVACHGDNIRYVAEWNQWIVWNKSSGRWEKDQDGAVTRLAEETVLAIFNQALALSNQADRNELLKHAMRSQSEARINSMINLARAEEGVTISTERLDADPWLLGVQNGVVELRDGKFRSPLREDLITKCAGTAFDPYADCPNWDQFLRTITNNDRGLQTYLQRVVGYILTGSVREEVCFIFYGVGRNGKSTFRETVHTLLGSYALAADANLMIERKTSGGATEEIARLKGKRFVAINETSENDQLNETRIKFITSQDMISARNLYGHYFDFFPTHKAAITTNHKPIIRGTDEGIWRRVHLVPFLVSIAPQSVERDFRERRLLRELPGILNWALEGLDAYLRQGLNPPSSVLASTQDYRADMDVVGQWIAERCEIDPHARVPTAQAYGDYFNWAREELGWELTKLKFRRHLTDRGFGLAKGAGGKRLITGLRLKPSSPPPSAVIGIRDDGELIYDNTIPDPAPGGKSQAKEMETPHD
jgi:putative DNA primase/helicase